MRKMSEHEIQRNFFNWVRRNIPDTDRPEYTGYSKNPGIQNALSLCYAVNNNAQKAQKAKMEGLTKGILDANLDWPIFCGMLLIPGLRLEFKYRKPPVSAKIQGMIDTGNYLVDLSPKQKEKRELFLKAGYQVAVVYSVKQAIQVVIDYLPFPEVDYIKPKYL